MKIFFQVFQALLHGWREGSEAAMLCDDPTSCRKLRADFVFSRLLKWWRVPGKYNSLRTVNIKGLPVSYRFNRGDLQSLREVMIEEVYAFDPSVRCDSVLDLGANIGLFSLWLRRCFEARGASSALSDECQVLAVEPVPTNAEVARINFRANQLSGEVICAAVSLHSGAAWFEAENESNLGRLVNDISAQTAASSNSSRIKVPVVGVRELLARFPDGKVDLVKMDIEGGEASLLGQELDWLVNVGALIIEWHDDRADSRPLLRNLQAAGFQHQRINAARQDNLSLLVRSQWRA